MEFCYPQDFLDEIHSARKNRQITASFLQKKLSNQGAEEARKNRQIKASFSARNSRQLNLVRSVINIGFLKEWKKT